MYECVLIVKQNVCVSYACLRWWMERFSNDWNSGWHMNMYVFIFQETHSYSMKVFIRIIRQTTWPEILWHINCDKHDSPLCWLANKIHLFETLKIKFKIYRYYHFLAKSGTRHIPVHRKNRVDSMPAEGLDSSIASFLPSMELIIRSLEFSTKMRNLNHMHHSIEQDDSKCNICRILQTRDNSSLAWLTLAIFIHSLISISLIVPLVFT